MTTRITVRKSGGSTIISLPKLVLEALHLHVGSTIDLSVEKNKIVLTPVNEGVETLEALLKGYTQKDFKLTEEDQAWVRAKRRGKEL